MTPWPGWGRFHSVVTKIQRLNTEVILIRGSTDPDDMRAVRLIDEWMAALNMAVLDQEIDNTPI
jgi:hypothetical protein